METTTLLAIGVIALSVAVLALLVAVVLVARQVRAALSLAGDLANCARSQVDVNEAVAEGFAALTGEVLDLWEAQ